MNKLSFEHFMQMKEMAVADFGKHHGSHLNDIDRGYARWMLDQLEQGSGKFKFRADDGSGYLTNNQLLDALKIRVVQNKKIAPTSVNQPVVPAASTATQRTPAQPSQKTPEPEKPVVAAKEPDKAQDKPQSPSEIIAQPDINAPKSATNPHILDKEKLSEEQKSIDEQFEKMMKGSGNHIMINALAGTGKTTILKHLAWKYGKPGQKWLYLVFNTKNRAEAKESTDGWKKFPDWVEVYTTNSFLGHVLARRENEDVLPSTDRMSNLDQGGKKGKKLEKSQALADSSLFQDIMTNSYKLPSWANIESDVEDVLDDLQIGDKYRPAYIGAIKSIVTTIRYEYQEAALKLLGLLKSFGVDPRNEDNLDRESERIFQKYDSHKDEEGKVESGYFGSKLDKAKDRIRKYKPFFRENVKEALRQLLGYDLMSKNFKDEILHGARWLLIQSLPKNTSVKHQHGPLSLDLGDFRDFSDDIWFPTIYADKIKWPEYDVVLADEVQDFNEGQKVMIKKLIDAGAKVVAVGDPNQAIYRFRGADNAAFDNLANTLKDASKDKQNWKPQSLSLNFRSRPEVLDFVNKMTHVKDLKGGKKFKETDPTAQVTNREIKYDDSFDQIKKERQDGNYIETAYIARTNQPLVNAALKLLAQGIPFAIVGKDVSGDIIDHIDKITRANETYKFRALYSNESVDVLAQRLQEFQEKELDRYSGLSTKKEHLSDLKDTTAAIANSLETFQQTPHAKTIKTFEEWLKSKIEGNSFDWEQSGEGKAESELKKFQEKVKKEKPVILTTSHKSKGLEFSRVYILRDDQFPHPKAKHPEEQNQEKNTQYVAYTRAMHQLHILALDDQPGVEKVDLEKNWSDDVD